MGAGLESSRVGAGAAGISPVLLRPATIFAEGSLGPEVALSLVTATMAAIVSLPGVEGEPSLPCPEELPTVGLC